MCVCLCIHVYNGMSAIMRGNNHLVLCVQSSKFSFPYKFWISWTFLRPVGITAIRTEWKHVFLFSLILKYISFHKCYSSKVENNSIGGRVNYNLIDLTVFT